MNKYVRKNLFLITAIIFAVVFIAIPFLHNHVPSLRDIEECPAHILTISLLSFAIGIQIYLLIFSVTTQQFILLKPIHIPLDFYATVFVNKAPPFAR